MTPICHFIPKFIAQIALIVVSQWIWSLKNQPLLKTHLLESGEGLEKRLLQTLQPCNPHNLPLLKQTRQDDLVACRGATSELLWVINFIASISSLLLLMPPLISEINSLVRTNMPSSRNSMRSYLLSTVSVYYLKLLL